jgi:hypothetical protein
MQGIVSAHIPWNVISNRVLRQAFNALCSDFVPPSTSTLSNICSWEYSLTIEAIKQQLLTQHKVSVALNG